MTRVLGLAAVLLAVSGATGQVPWADKVTTPAAEVSVPPVELTPLLTSGTADWPSRRTEIRSQWLKILGPLPAAPPDGIKVEEIADESLSTCSRKLVKYEAEPGRFVRAYIVRPAGDEHTTRPGIVVFHPTNKESIKVVAGTGGRDEQHVALRLAERGFVCICPENYINEEKSWLAGVAEAKKRHPKSTGMATMLADGMRAVDVLMKLPGVDQSRIGTIGHSLGGKEALYLMAFDDRVKAGVSSEGGISVHASNWYADWYLGSQIKKPGFTHDHHELLALIIPRPFLVFGGETGRAADGDRTWPYVIAANNLAEKLGMPRSIGFINHHEDHSFHPAQVERALDWLQAGVIEGSK